MVMVDLALADGFCADLFRIPLGRGGGWSLSWDVGLAGPGLFFS